MDDCSKSSKVSDSPDSPEAASELWGISAIPWLWLARGGVLIGNSPQGFPLGVFCKLPESYAEASRLERVVLRRHIRRVM